MESVLATLGRFFGSSLGAAAGRAALVLVVGLVVARLLREVVRKLVGRSMSADHATVVGRLVFTLLVGVVVLGAAHQLGFDLSVLLGAAGILTVALGFASQTSASNLISGLFLLGERPFVVGDIVRFKDITGEVVSIDLLSVKLRTFDNLFVRLPNEMLLKSEITTLTRYQIRRLDLVLRVPYSVDLARVREVLAAVAEADPRCLDEPEPVTYFDEFVESAQQVKFTAWVTRELYIEVKNTLPEAVVRALREADIELAVPRRAIVGAADGAPLAVAGTR